MPKSTNLALPQKVHDHFQSANRLHKQVQKSLGEATEYALKIGQELLAAKQTIPHGSWESECERLFDGSLRTAQFYMQVAKNLEALPKAQASAILFLEGSLEGVAKAARKAAKPPPPPPVCPYCGDDPESPCDYCKPPPPPTDDLPVEDLESSEGGGSFDEAPESPETAPSSESPPAPEGDPGATGGPEQPGTGPCPNCNRSEWDEDEDGYFCVKCSHPWGEPAGDVDDSEITTQRQKTCKTAEALGREFYKLHRLSPRGDYEDVDGQCKVLLKTAREWK